jgi:hypothetical protein
MDVVALRTGIQASLDANADTRRQAEIDLKAVGTESWRAGLPHGHSKYHGRPPVADGTNMTLGLSPYRPHKENFTTFTNRRTLTG